jgi:serine/threonine-protein kinase
MVAAGAALLLVVVMGIAGTTVGLVRARAAEQQASREAEAANQISDFLVGLFKDSDPLRGQGDQVTTRQLLDTGYERIRERLVDRPDLQARLLHTLGSVYRSLGVRETAGESLESALQLRATLDGPDSLEYAETLHELGNLNRQRGDFDEAASMLEQALAIRRMRLGSVDPLVAATLNDLAIVHHDLNQYDRAEPLYREALDIYRSIPEVDDVSIGETLTSFGALLQLRGRLEEAEPLVREAVDRMRTAHGDDHPYVGFTIHNLSWLLRDLGDLEGAEAASRSALEVFERAFGDAHFTVANACNLLAQILREDGRFEEALVTGQRGFELSKAAFGEDHFATGDSAFNVGAILTDMERDAEARVYLLEALKINRTVFGDGSPETDTVLLGLGVVDESLGELELAEQRYREVVEIRRSADPPAPARLGCALSVLGNLEIRTGRFAAAVTDLQAAWDLLQENEQYPRDCILATEMRLGEALAGLGRYEEAEDHLLRAHEAYSGPPRRGYADEDWRENLDRSAERLHELYTAWGKPERARRYDKRRPGA